MKSITDVIVSFISATIILSTVKYWSEPIISMLINTVSLIVAKKARVGRKKGSFVQRGLALRMEHQWISEKKRNRVIFSAFVDFLFWIWQFGRSSECHDLVKALLVTEERIRLISIYVFIAWLAEESVESSKAIEDKSANGAIDKQAPWEIAPGLDESKDILNTVIAGIARQLGLTQVKGYVGALRVIYCASQSRLAA
jgi:hypothetical protein